MGNEWDDLRVILGVWRGGSARGANKFLGLSHATIARRIDSLETRWGVRVFDRLPSGYALTQDGEEILQTALEMEADMNAMRLRLTGREQSLAGLIRITTIDTMASHFLMPRLARFSELYPDIEFELVIGYQELDLRKREADIAIRGTQKPPEHLIGHKLAPIAWAAYASQQYIDAHRFEDDGDARWIGFGTRLTDPVWPQRTHYPNLPVWGLFDDVALQVEAAKNGLGAVHIPCYVGDQQVGLVRVPPGQTTTEGEFWLLRHKDTRTTARLRVFSDFLTEAFRHNTGLFAGHA